VEAEPLNVNVTEATARMPFFQAPLLFLASKRNRPLPFRLVANSDPQFRKAWWQANIA